MVPGQPLVNIFDQNVVKKSKLMKIPRKIELFPRKNLLYNLENMQFFNNPPETDLFPFKTPLNPQKLSQDGLVRLAYRRTNFFEGGGVKYP